MPRIFLSYATPDRERALAVKILLEIGGGEVFMDCYRIPYGSDWRTAIEHAVSECHVLCVFWSRHTPRSTWVEREYSAFMRLHPERPCVPLCADETPLPAALSARQAPPFLELANQFLALRERLGRQRVSRRETERLVDLELEASGVRVDRRQRKQLLKLFVGGISVLALLKWFFEIVPKWKLALAVGLCAAGAFVARVTYSADDRAVPPAAPAHRAAAVPIPVPAPPPLSPAVAIDASLRADASRAADARNPDCVDRQPYTLSTDEITPIVEHTEEPLCALLAKLYPASDRGFVGIAVEPGVAYTATPASFPICDDSVREVRWSSSIGFEPFQCDIKMHFFRTPHTAATASVVFECSRTIRGADRAAELAHLRDSFERCLASSDGWDWHVATNPDAVGANFFWEHRWAATLDTQPNARPGGPPLYSLTFHVWRIPGTDVR